MHTDKQGKKLSKLLQVAAIEKITRQSKKFASNYAAFKSWRTRQSVCRITTKDAATLERLGCGGRSRRWGGQDGMALCKLQYLDASYSWSIRFNLNIKTYPLLPYLVGSLLMVQATIADGENTNNKTVAQTMKGLLGSFQW